MVNETSICQNKDKMFVDILVNIVVIATLFPTSGYIPARRMNFFR